MSIASRALRRENPMKSLTEYLTFNVPARMDLLNITPQVEAIVARSGVQEGLFHAIEVLKPRINRLALQSQNAEDAFMHSAKRLLADEPLQPLKAEGELAESEGSFVAQPAIAQPGDVLVGSVVRAVNDTQVFSPTTLHGWLS